MTRTPDQHRPRPLWWLYGLIAVALTSLGVAAGNLFFRGTWSLLLPYGLTTARCEALHRESLDMFGDCAAEQLRVHGLVVAAVALVLLAGTLTLAVVVPWWDLRRLGRLGQLDVPPAQQRFAELCQRQGLSRGRTPRLWVAGPAVRHAFTTALPGRRPTVVVPARLALDAGDRFDAVVSHEIAHVLARDVSLVSTTRGPAWLAPPAVVLAGVPFLNLFGVTPGRIAAQLGVALLAVVVTLLAAALLRLREHEADRYAASVGTEVALTASFARTASAARHRPFGWARRMLARHPRPADRVRALRQPAPGYEGGFAQALAVGFVAVAAMYTTLVMASFGDPQWYTWGSGIVPVVAGVAVLGLLFPSLLRRARLPHRGWWRPVLGTAAGVGGGAVFMPVVFLSEPLRYPLAQPGEPARTALSVVLVMLVAAGAVALAAHLADMAARRQRPVHAWLAGGAAGLAAVAALWTVGVVAAVLHDLDDLRYLLTYGLANQAWPALLLGPLPVYALLSPRRLPGGRRSWLVALVAAALGGAAAILVTAESADLTDQLRAQQQRWWLCAAAGVVVLVVVTLSTGWPDGWTRGVLAATATTVTATAAHYGYGRLTDRPTEPDMFTRDVAVGPLWLGYAVMLLAALLIPLSAARRGPMITESPGRGRTTPAWLGTTATTTATAVLVTAVAVVVVNVGVPGGVAMNAGQRRLADFDRRYEVARRVLTAEQADRAAQSSVQVIPSSWGVVESGPAGQGIASARVAVSVPECEPLVRERFLTVGEPNLRATGKQTYTSEPTDGEFPYSDLTVTVYAYDAAVGETVLTAARDARRACPSFTLDDTLDVEVRAATAPGLGELSWRYDSTMTADLADGTTVTAANAYVMMAIGYAVVTVFISAWQEPLDEQLLRLVLATVEHQLLQP
ncbi:M48 family metalloprotease [Verrucosispora sp. WMMD573]|uniref:M48 family metalloprotease n=1 Tax=Verrucosispora sp. WMMD573 TaxID=3015149 RepID=UPI00248BFEA4|nr:M48 family metalloprotease [Verrucosispora sp. WMMD573]WBB53373.1 M48 family metalloprotease [Verrucosispora sp. WMMD573]